MELYKIQFVAAISFQYSNLVLDCRAVASTRQSEALASVIFFRGFVNAGIKNTVNTCEENLTMDNKCFVATAVDCSSIFLVDRLHG